MTDTETLDATVTASELAYSEESEPVEYSVLTPREAIAAEIREVLKDWPRCDLSKYANPKCKLCYGRGRATYRMGQNMERVERVCNCVNVKLRTDPKSALRIVPEKEGAENA